MQLQALQSPSSPQTLALGDDCETRRQTSERAATMTLCSGDDDEGFSCDEDEGSSTGDEDERAAATTIGETLQRRTTEVTMNGLSASDEGVTTMSTSSSYE
nr:hypothetical protein Iba_chr02bCG13650 [Ipomoea batatas]